jgi:hypothetical protein
MLNVKKIIINENIKHNASSNIKFVCNTDKLNFPRLIKSQSMRPLFFDKVNFDTFEINLQVICLNEGLIQSVDKDGAVLMKGDFFHKNDCSYTYLNLSTEINNSNWLKLKSDVLFLKNENLQFSIFNIVFNEIINDDENDCMESNIEAAFESYKILKTLN